MIRKSAYDFRSSESEIGEHRYRPDNRKWRILLVNIRCIFLVPELACEKDNCGVLVVLVVMKKLKKGHVMKAHVF
jgi:hypothetical protein